MIEDKNKLNNPAARVLKTNNPACSDPSIIPTSLYEFHIKRYASEGTTVITAKR